MVKTIKIMIGIKLRVKPVINKVAKEVFFKSRITKKPKILALKLIKLFKAGFWSANKTTLMICKTNLIEKSANVIGAKIFKISWSIEFELNISCQLIYLLNRNGKKAIGMNIIEISA